MQLLEPIETLNQRLIDYFGIDTVTGQAMYQIVFSEDVYVKQLTEYSDGGILLLQPEYRLLPKYKQWIQQKFLIEKLVIVPDFQVKEAATKISYEPLFVFANKNDEYLPPKWEVAELVIRSVLAATGKSSLKKYSDGIKTQEDDELARKKRIEDMIEYFGGDESGLTGTTLNCGSAVIVPQNYKKDL